MTNASSKSIPYAFFTRSEYFRDLARLINHAKKDDRILVSTMAFDASDAYVADIVTALEQAARRGANVTFLVDAYDFMQGNAGFGPLWLYGKMPNTSHLHGFLKASYDALTRISTAGGECVVTNMPARRFTNYFKGRSHIKVAVINNNCFVGGSNLHHHEQIDCTVGWHDKKSADWLYYTMSQLAKRGTNELAFSGEDQEFHVSSDTELLLDSGIKRQSIILEKAFEVIDNAQQWIFITSQFFPNSLTAQHLRKAHRRGVKVFPLLNHVSQHDGVHAVIQRVVTPFERLRSPGSFFDLTLPKTAPFLHAKVVANETEAIIGSHNYIIAGVNFGTAELALHCKNASFARAACTTVLRQTPFLKNHELFF